MWRQVIVNCLCWPCIALNRFWLVAVQQLNRFVEKLRSDTFFRHIVLLYFVTFFIILPPVCQQLKYSLYNINHGNITLNKELSRIENTISYNKARAYLDMLDATKLNGMFAVGSNDSSKVVDVALGVITVSRNRHFVDEYEPRYLTQVIWKLLSLYHSFLAAGNKCNIKMFICNVDPDPLNYEEVKSLESVINVRNRFDKLTFTFDHVLEKEKKDYVFCLNSSLEYHPQYVLLIEDDALPNDDFFTVLNYVIDEYLNRKLFRDDERSMNSANISYIKLYHPERLLGFLNPELQRFGDLLGIAAVVSSVISLVYWKCCMYSTKPAYHQLFLHFFCFALILSLAIGRQNLIGFRYLFTPYLYHFVPAPECCTPAMLFPRGGATQLAHLLDQIKCGKNFGKDMAIWSYRNQLNSYMVQPNLVKHIGMYSAVRSVVLDPFIV